MRTVVNWIYGIKNANRQTIFFALNWIAYFVMIVATTLYVYARLDFVRSGPKHTSKVNPK